MAKLVTMIHKQQMENTLWTLWHPSHVTMDTPDQDPALDTVKFKETGIRKLQLATRVNYNQILVTMEIIILFLSMAAAT